MEKRKLNVIFNKSGSGSLSSKICIPISYLHIMGVTEENKEVTMFFNYETNEIIIKKE